VYWECFKNQGYYFAGDDAKYDADGDIWMLGGVKDLMNVSGHRGSTTEVESALVFHAAVAEAAVVGATDETTDQSNVAFVILRTAVAEDTHAVEIVAALKYHVALKIGAIARPNRILIVPELPKPRSGKNIHRLLRDHAYSREVGNGATLSGTSTMQIIGESIGPLTGPS
jgi:acetyl-CoA synthetase